MSDSSTAPDFSQVRGIYFDLDDTLCAYWDASKTALVKTFDAHPIEGYTTAEMVRHWAAAFRDFAPTLKQTGWYPGYLLSGDPTRLEQMRLTLTRIGVDNPSHAAELSATYRKTRDEALALFPDALDLLTYLKQKYPMGLITNGPADIQREEVVTLNLEPFFEHILIEGEVGEGKPLQSVFRKAQQLMGFEPHEMLFVGNSYDHDMAPAIEAGWRTVWIRRASDVPPSADLDKEPTPKEKPIGSPDPDVVVDNLSALGDWL